MDTNRANLDQPQSNTKYLFFTIILVILSVIGIFLFFKIKATDTELGEVPASIPEIIPDPTPAVVEPTTVPKTIIEEPSPAEVIKVPAEGTPYPEGHRGEPTPAFQTYDGVEDGFTLSYKSDRKVYKINENTGHRIAFYRIGGNIVVHVGSDWSWSHPGREFTGVYTLSGQPAFRYDIAAQTLVDVKYGDKFYTIQCIHNSDENLKSECEQLIISFKFL